MISAHLGFKGRHGMVLRINCGGLKIRERLRAANPFDTHEIVFCCAELVNLET